MTNRFNGLALKDRVPEDKWMEVHDSVEEAVIKTIPKKRNAKRRNGCLRRPCKKLRKEEKLKERRKGKIYQFECKDSKNSKEIRKTSSEINAKK